MIVKSFEVSFIELVVDREVVKYSFPSLTILGFFIHDEGKTVKIFPLIEVENEEENYFDEFSTSRGWWLPSVTRLEDFSVIPTGQRWFGLEGLEIIESEGGVALVFEDSEEVSQRTLNQMKSGLIDSFNELDYYEAEYIEEI